MIQSMIPLANWGVGTAIIGVFVLVCIALTAIVLNFIFKGKKKDDTLDPSENKGL